MGKKSSAKKAIKEISEELVSDAIEKSTGKTALEVPEQPEKSEPQEPKTRQIIIETDGVSIKLVKAEASNLELQSILGNLLEKIKGN